VQFQFELAAKGGAETPGMAMSSQAKQLEYAEKLPDGTVIRLRSVRRGTRGFFGTFMSPEDLRLCFLVAMRELSHELAARLSHIDHDRDVALFAIAEGAEEVLGTLGFRPAPTTALPNSPSRCVATGKGSGLATC